MRPFTLLELLIVIGVIAFLFTLLLPALQKTQSLAKRIQCTANAKTVFAGAFHYTEDFNGYLMHKPSVGGGAGINIQRYLHTYTFFPKSLIMYGPESTHQYDTDFRHQQHFNKYFACPEWAKWAGKNMMWPWGGGACYGHNITLSPLDDTDKRCLRGIYQVRTPSKTCMIAEQTDTNYITGGYWGFIYMNPKFYEKHLSANTVIYVDGHAQNMPMKTFPAFSNIFFPRAPGIVIGNDASAPQYNLRYTDFWGLGRVTGSKLPDI